MNITTKHIESTTILLKCKYRKTLHVLDIKLVYVNALLFEVEKFTSPSLCFN